jgi:hypothetical protein
MSAIPAIGAPCAPPPHGLNYDSKGFISFDPRFLAELISNHVELASNRVEIRLFNSLECTQTDRS